MLFKFALTKEDFARRPDGPIKWPFYVTQNEVPAPNMHELRIVATFDCGAELILLLDLPMPPGGVVRILPAYIIWDQP